MTQATFKNFMKHHCIKIYEIRNNVRTVFQHKFQTELTYK